jgi:hypothetical protein
MIEDYTGQAVSVETPSTVNNYGEPTWSAPVSYVVRYEARAQLVRDAQGQQVVSSARVFFPATATVSLNSRVTYAGTTYRVISVESAEGLDGPSHLIAYLGG